MNGLLQLSTSAPPSSLQKYAEPALLEENANTAVVWFVSGGGPETMVACGGFVSIVHANDDAAETFPAGSVAVAVKRWLPSTSGAYVAGLVHGAASRASSLQENVEPGSLEEKLNVAVVSLVRADGPDASDTAGAVVSTIHVNDAGAGTFPIASRAVMAKVWLPSASPPYVTGLVHGAAALESSVHEKVVPSPLEVNVKLASMRFVRLSGDEVIARRTGTAGYCTMPADLLVTARSPLIVTDVTPGAKAWKSAIPSPVTASLPPWRSASMLRRLARQQEPRAVLVHEDSRPDQ